MTIIVKYERKDFFGQRIYTEDKKESFKFDDLKHAFRLLSKDSFAAIEIFGNGENAIYFWDCMDDFKNRMLTKRTFGKMFHDNYRISFNSAKTILYKKYRNEGE